MYAESALPAGLFLPFVLVAQAGPPANAALGLGLLCVAIPFVILMVLTVGAVILRTACSVCGVEPPSFMSAVGIFFATGMAVGAADTGIGFAINLLMAEAGANGQLPWQITSLVVGLIASALISGFMYSTMISNCSFGKGIQIWLVEKLFYVLLAVVLGGLVLLALFAAGAL